MATLVASGSQFGRVSDAELLLFLRSCVDDEVMPPAVPSLRRRIERVRRVIAMGDSGRVLHIEAGLDLPGFLGAVEDHGAGFLAQLTARIRMGWDGPVLANQLSLTDLPGLGVANDIHRLQASAEGVPFRPILLVVDRAGLPEASATVLSDSSEAYDRGQKFAHYRRLASLREYVLVSQREPLLELYRKDERGHWVLFEVGPGQSLELASLGGIQIACDAVYRNPLAG